MNFFPNSNMSFALVSQPSCDCSDHFHMILCRWEDRCHFHLTSCSHAALVELAFMLVELVVTTYPKFGELPLILELISWLSSILEIWSKFALNYFVYSELNSIIGNSEKKKKKQDRDIHIHGGGLEENFSIQSLTHFHVLPHHDIVFHDVQIYSCDGLPNPPDAQVTEISK